MLFGIDVHPVYQAGLNIEQVRTEGFDFISIKVSEGTDASYMAQGSANWLRRAKACGLLAMGYHYLHAGDEIQQAHVFAEQLLTAGVPGVIDAESVDASGRATLTIGGIRAFVSALAGFDNVFVPLLYLPYWYWKRIGSPDLGGLPALWASSYVAGAGYASTLYESVTPSFWAAYGGLPVAALQFTDRALVNGMYVDANAFFGTRDQFASLLQRSPAAPTEDGMGITHIFVDPGSGTKCFQCPVGTASQIVGNAWISAMVNGPNNGSVRFWFQDDTEGINEVPAHTTAPQALNFSNGHSDRWDIPVPDRTTMIRADYVFPDGGTICLETKAK